MLELSGNWEPRTVYTLHEYVRQWTSYLVFLVETKAKQKCMEKIKFKLGFSNGLLVPSQGKSGGLALLWSKDVKLEIKSYSQHHINATITEHESNYTWRFTGFYSHSESHTRKESWKLLFYLNNQFSLPWFYCGDFNEILFLSKKSGGPQRTQCQMEGYRDAVNDCDFQDLRSSRPQFTWCNMREGSDRIYLCLDWAFANSDWLNKFNNYRVHHVVDSTSDHCIPRITDSRAPPPSRKHPFHFEALWAKQDNCHGIVEPAWDSGSLTNTPEGIATNLSLCTFELSSWCKEVFGRIPKRIQEKRKLLHTLIE